MSTIPDNPFDVTKPETYPAVPTTADQRAQHASGNAAFAAAKTDVENLETGKEDAGTAAGLVATHEALDVVTDDVHGAQAYTDQEITAHNASGAAHGGVEVAFQAHDGAGGTAHADASGAFSGFMSPADKNKLDAIDLANTGTLREVQDEGVQVTDGGKILNFIGAGVTATDGGAGRTDITIPGSPGGGEENTQSNQGGGVELGLPKSGADLPLRTLDTGQFELNGNQVRIPAGTFLGAVQDDTSPILGGALKTKGSYIDITKSDDTVVGALGEIPGGATGAAFGYFDGTGLFDQSDGGVTVEPARVQLYGTTVNVVGLKHTEPVRQQVYVASSGDLYRVDEPPTGWTSQGTSTTTASMGSGTGAGAWVDTGITLDFGADVEIGQRLDISVSLYIENRTDDKPGSISVGFGFNSATPTAPAATVTIGEYFEGWVPVAFSTLSDAAYTTADDVDIFVRRESSDDSNFNPWLAYEGTDPHEGLLSTPGASGGGGGSGIAKGTPFVQDELMGVQSTANDGTANTVGFGPSDVARLSQSVSFAGVVGATDAVAVSGALSAVADMFHTAAPAQSGRWYIASASGFLIFSSRDDAGNEVGGTSQLAIGHANSVAGQGVTVGAVTFPGAGALAVENGIAAASLQTSGAITSTGGAVEASEIMRAQGVNQARLELIDISETGGTTAHVAYESGLIQFRSELVGPLAAMTIGRQDTNNAGLYIGPTRPGDQANGTLRTQQQITADAGGVWDAAARCLSTDNALTLANNGGVSGTFLTLTGTQTYQVLTASPLLLCSGTGTLTLSGVTGGGVVTMHVPANTLTVVLQVAGQWQQMGAQDGAKFCTATISNDGSNQVISWRTVN